MLNNYSFFTMKDFRKATLSVIVAIFLAIWPSGKIISSKADSQKEESFVWLFFQTSDFIEYL